MKLKYKFAYQKTTDGYAAVAVDEDAEKFNGILHLNETGASIMKLLEKEQTEESLIEELRKQYEDPDEQMAPVVHTFLKKLRDSGLLEG